MTNFFGATSFNNTILLGLMLPFVVLEIGKKALFKKEIILLLLGLMLNLLACQYFRDQSLFSTFRASANFIYIFFYFVLRYINPTLKETEKAMFILIILFCIAYIVQYIVYPTVIFRGAAIEYSEDIRIRLAGGGLSSLGFFMGLNKYLEEKDRKYLFLVFLCIIPIFLMGFRTMLGALVIFSFILFIKTYGFSWKLFLYGVLGIGVVLVLLQIPIFADKLNSMMERQQTDNFSNSDYVRVINFQYYTQQHFNSVLEYLLGSGMPFENTSAYARSMMRLQERGIFYVDFGLLGLSWILGIIPVLLMITYSIKAFLIKVSSQYYFLGIWFIYLVGISFTTVEFYREGNFVIQALVLFMVEKAYRQRILSEKKQKEQIVVTEQYPIILPDKF